MTTTTDADYTQLARNLAEALMRYARDRRTEDQKEIGVLQHQLCQMRRIELTPEPPPNDQQS
jgi:hypothetical protein